MDKIEKKLLKKLIDVAAKNEAADLVIKNCKIVDVYNADIIEGDIAIAGGKIAGIGSYTGKRELDGEGSYALPGLIDSHIHVESAYLSPEELGRLLVPCGTTTIIADAHEIANVCGEDGLKYMIQAGKETALDIKWMLPSCVPATEFEQGGAVIDSKKLEALLCSGLFWGVGELMDFQSVTVGKDEILDKIMAAKSLDMVIDGHCPGISESLLDAYIASGVKTDHECSEVKELTARLTRGMYVLLRQGSACKNLKELLKGVTPANSRRCLLCTDDCQPKTIINEGHLDNHLRICVEHGIDPITAIQMATLNGAECYGLQDRGAIAPGLRADIVLMEDLKEFKAKRVFIEGMETAVEGIYRLPVNHCDISKVRGSFKLPRLSAEAFSLPLRSSRVNTIKLLPGGIVTKKKIMDIKQSSDGSFLYDDKLDVIKLAVVQRYDGSGTTGVGLLCGYGLKKGAIAASVVHDSHNIIVAGLKDSDMCFAVNKLAEQGGGIILVCEGEVLENMPMPIGGLMCCQDGKWVQEKLEAIHQTAHEVMGVSKEVEPIMTLSFMGLPVIPEVKLTYRGLFDVMRFEFISVEAY